MPPPRIPQEILNHILAQLYDLPDLGTLVHSCAAVSRAWHAGVVHVLKSLKTRTRNGEDEVFWVNVGKGGNGNLEGDGVGRMRAIMHPTLHGGALLTLHTYPTNPTTSLPDDPLHTTLIDTSTGLESLQTALQRVGLLTHPRTTPVNTLFEAGARRIDKWVGGQGKVVEVWGGKCVREGGKWECALDGHVHMEEDGECSAGLVVGCQAALERWDAGREKDGGVRRFLFAV
ncbi:hypothetical protein HK104_002150, partial [Borealophlyctis nickersoniae]